MSLKLHSDLYDALFSLRQYMTNYPLQSLCATSLKSVLVILRGRVEERKRFSNEEKDPITLKELNEKPYEVKISCTGSIE